jgi:hypothetical protein
MICGLGMTNALVLSYTRVPFAMAQDGYLPTAFLRVHPKTGAPWVSILACAVAWTVCLPLGFERLVLIDIILYGVALLLEFVALVVLRVREPDLPRRFRAPARHPRRGCLGHRTRGAAGAHLRPRRERAHRPDHRARLGRDPGDAGRAGVFLGAGEEMRKQLAISS